MSTQAVTEFLTKAAQDQAIGDKLQTGTMEDKIATAVKVGAEHGHSFTADECREVFQAARHSREGTLSDQQLEGVAGGGIQGMLGTVWKWLSDTVGGSGDGDSGGSQGVCGVRA